MSETDDRYAKHLEDRVREKALDVAAYLREIADRIEREAKAATGKKLHRLPADVTHILEWGVANANASAIGYAVADLVEVQQMLLREAAEGDKP